MTTLCNPREAELLTVVVDTNVLIELFLPTQNGDVVQRLWDADRDWRLPVLSV
jgi:predicted nucleic acid-binding protein